MRIRSVVVCALVGQTSLRCSGIGTLSSIAQGVSIWPTSDSPSLVKQAALRLVSRAESEGAKNRWTSTAGNITGVKVTGDSANAKALLEAIEEALKCCGNLDLQIDASGKVGVNASSN